jgi:hypothetical protein
MRHDERTREYVARRTAEGKSKREIMRCLKRYIDSPGDLPPTGADGCGFSGISTEVPGSKAEPLNCPSLNIGASKYTERAKSTVYCLELFDTTKSRRKGNSVRSRLGSNTEQREQVA